MPSSTLPAWLTSSAWGTEYAKQKAAGDTYRTQRPQGNFTWVWGNNLTNASKAPDRQQMWQSNLDLTNPIDINGIFGIGKDALMDAAKTATLNFTGNSLNHMDFTGAAGKVNATVKTTGGTSNLVGGANADTVNVDGASKTSFYFNGGAGDDTLNVTANATNKDNLTVKYEGGAGNDKVTLAGKLTDYKTHDYGNGWKAYWPKDATNKQVIYVKDVETVNGADDPPPNPDPDDDVPPPP
jgi:hypothetical protein